MKVEIIKSISGQPIGWQITGETPEENEVVSIIRDLQFYGFKETSIKYAGRFNVDDKNKNPGTLTWMQEKEIT